MPRAALAKAFVRLARHERQRIGTLGRFGKPPHGVASPARSRIRITDLGPWPVTAPIAR